MQSFNPHALRDEIAAVAARMIAEDGLDYAGAKRRAAREVIGDDRRTDAGCMPDNAQVEAAVREHQALFMADTQPARLHALRLQARDAMRFLAGAGRDLAPWVTGAIVNGTAGEHSDIHLQVYNDNAKDIEIFLLNAGIDFDVTEGQGTRGDGGETLSFLWPPRIPGRRTSGPVEPETIHLAVLDPRDQRIASTKVRTDLAGLDALIEAHPDPTPS